MSQPEAKSGGNMLREDCLKTLAGHYSGQLVVSVYTTCFEWMAICSQAINYVSVGAMGQAGSHALGLALGRPDQEVWVFDGDGSLLMNLGSLVTLAGMQPRNLTHFVFQNGSYEANQRMPLPVAEVDFAGIARGAGIASTAQFRDTASLDAWLASRKPMTGRDGPSLVDLRVLPSPRPYPQHYDHIHSAEARESFKAALRAIPVEASGARAGARV
ncbi:MAG: thiamine pyrophosphate-dependent enzyme [Pseudomonadota bacterium]